MSRDDERKFISSIVAEELIDIDMTEKISKLMKTVKVRLLIKFAKRMMKLETAKK